MHDVNWWLMGLAFLLGLVLTLVFMIRRVTREVPVYAALGRGPKVEVRKPDVEVKKPGLAAPAVAAAGVTAAKLVKDQPYGAGSVRVPKTVAPTRAEYLVKGDEDTMRYFTVDSPDYETVGAEVWFTDVESAERAGFARWDATGAAKLVSAVEPGPYGAGSAKVAAGASGPQGWLIKGNEDSMLYHTPASPQYDVTIAELWFVDEATAEAAGFKKYK